MEKNSCSYQTWTYLSFHGDVLSNELFCHTPWLTKNTNQYNSLLSTNNIDSLNDTWIKQLALNKIILYIRDAEVAGPGTVFMVAELETLNSMVDGHGILWCTHVSQFSELQDVRVPGLPKGLSCNKLSMFFYSAVQNNVQNPQDSGFKLQSVVCVVSQQTFVGLQNLWKTSSRYVLKTSSA